MLCPARFSCIVFFWVPDETTSNSGKEPPTIHILCSLALGWALLSLLCNGGSVEVLHGRMSTHGFDWCYFISYINTSTVNIKLLNLVISYSLILTSRTIELDKLWTNTSNHDHSLLQFRITQFRITSQYIVVHHPSASVLPCHVTKQLHTRTGIVGLLSWLRAIVATNVNDQPPGTARKLPKGEKMIIMSYILKYDQAQYAKNWCLYSKRIDDVETTNKWSSTKKASLF